MIKLTDLEIEALLNRLENEIADDLESYHLDLKSWKDVGEARRTAIEYAVCFANAGGGVIIFGINDKICGRTKAIQGVDRVSIDAFAKDIFQGTQPSIHASVRLVDVPEGTGQLLIVEIPEGEQKPYGTASGLYKQRVEKNCMPLDPVVFQKARISSGAVDWSGALAQGVNLTDLDPLQLARARNILRSKDPSSGLLEMMDLEFLQGLEVVQGGQMTHAGVLLFARQDVLARVCPQAQFHYVFQKNEVDVSRNDISRLGLLEIVERMDQIFTGPLNPEKEISIGLFKTRIPDYPLEAIREALLNALTHRDYTDPGEILVRHAPTELVVTSPGGFIAGITPDNILRHEARPRNRTLANALVKLRLVESSGVGRKRIFRSALIYGKRKPEYTTDGYSVTLRIFNRGADVAIANIVNQMDAQGVRMSLDHLLVLDDLRDHAFMDTARGIEVLQLPAKDTLELLEQMAQPPLQLLERKGHTATATFYLGKGIAKELKGKAAYTKTRGLNPIRYAEMAREYLNDHQSITNAELRDLLSLGASKSASVEASKYLAKWSSEAGFLAIKGKGAHRTYYLKKLFT
jgi:ATP-dependent DNA helicase RecG